MAAGHTCGGDSDQFSDDANAGLNQGLILVSFTTFGLLADEDKNGLPINRQSEHHRKPQVFDADTTIINPWNM